MLTTNLKLLLVDDDPISLHLLAYYLREAGYDFVCAEDGLQAWQLLQQTPHQFGMVVSDRVMPGLHAVQLIQKMRQHALLKTIPVIVMTGIADKHEVIEAIKVGACDFLYKPIEKDLLLSVVKRNWLRVT